MIIFGLIGKPSSGKSTFLNASCLTSVKVSELPFTTIEANKGVAYLKKKCVCQELGINDTPKNSLCLSGNRFIQINLLDVAGLVPDAHKGKGLGNRFLNDLSRADVLLHIVDITGLLDKTGKKDITKFNDPIDDIIFLENEINLWFLDILKREDWQKFKRSFMRDKSQIIEALHKRLSGVKVSPKQISLALKESRLENKNPSEWNEVDILEFSKYLRKISKPILIIANKIDKDDSLKNLDELKKKYTGHIIPCSALAEDILRKYQENNKIEYVPGSSDFKILDPNALSSKEIEILNKIKSNILIPLNGTGVQNALNHAAFDILKLICVYPVSDVNNFSDKKQNILPDVFLIKKGTKLREFIKEKIHSDLAKQFIFGIDARTKRRLGENYELHDNDIVKIMTSK